jgi:hypothetical protein
MLRALRYFSVLVFVLGAIWILSTSSRLQTCIEKQTAAEGEQTKENSPPFVLSLTNNAAICIRCTGHVLYEYRDVVTAVATVFIAAFTFTLWWSTKAMMKATQSTVDLARQEFVATHRPRVILRYIQGPFYNDEGHQFIWLTFVNTGANDATIEAFGGDLAYRGGFNEAWESPGLDAALKDIDSITLVCGQRHVFTVTAKTSSNTDEAISKSAWPGFQICAVGQLRYKDGSGISRHTGFFRVLDDEGVNFVVSKHDSEMEYQD